MIIKIIFVLLCGVAGVFVGIMLKKRLDKKRDYFCDAKNFCDFFKHDLTFKQSKLKKIIDEYKYISDDFRNDIKRFSEEFKTDQEICEKLSKNEKQEITNLFSSLGKVDINTQMELIEERKKVLGDIADKYKSRSQKDGKLYVKLGLLSGLCLGVLLV